MIWTYVSAPYSHVEIITPWDDGIRRWGLSAVLRSWALMNGISVLMKRPPREPWPFPPGGDTASGHRLWTKNKALTQPGWCLDLGLSNLQNYEREISFFFFFNFNWRLITLQYCGGFCHTSTWISHGCTEDMQLWYLAAWME